MSAAAAATAIAVGAAAAKWKVFVTGGSGFVGGHLLRELRALGCTDIRALARSDNASEVSSKTIALCCFPYFCAYLSVPT
jgi:FlaA1/EpsC-like NDP-sugar epimerase